MLFELENLANGYDASTYSIRLLRGYLKGCCELGRRGFMNVFGEELDDLLSDSKDLHELDSVDYAVSIAGDVRHGSADTVKGVCLLQRLIDRRDITDSDIVDYCALKLSREFSDDGVHTPTELARLLECSQDFDSLDWYGDTFSYQVIAGRLIYMSELRRGYLLRDVGIVTSVSFSANGGVIRVSREGMEDCYIMTIVGDKDFTMFSRYDGTLYQVKKDLAMY